MIYYKGNLELISSIIDIDIELGKIWSHNSQIYYKAYSQKFETLDKYKRTFYFNHDKLETCNDKQFEEEFDKIFSISFLKMKKSQNCEIIYEEIFDQNNNKYGKELLTGLIFPIFERKYGHNSYFIYTHTKYNSIENAKICYVKKKTDIFLPALDKTECLLFNSKVADNNEIKFFNIVIHS